MKALIDEIGAKEGGKAFFDPVSIPKYTGESLTAVQVGFKRKQHVVDPDAKISPHSHARWFQGVVAYHDANPKPSSSNPLHVLLKLAQDGYPS